MTHWIFESWYELVPQPYAQIALTLAAAICGALIGVEREIKEKPAGVRTLALVSIGSSAFTMMSYLMSDGMPDRARVAAQIVTGVGFLGAGAILRSPLGVVGMTTAATIWVAAAVGMVIGSGYAGAGAGLTLLVILLLSSVSRLERFYQGECEMRSATIVFEPHGGKTRVKLAHMLEEHRLRGAPITDAIDAAGLERFGFSYCSKHQQHREVLTRLAAMREIVEMNVGN